MGSSNEGSSFKYYTFDDPFSSDNVEGDHTNSSTHPSSYFAGTSVSPALITPEMEVNLLNWKGAKDYAKACRKAYI